MTRILLFIPLLMLFSISVKALDNNETGSFVKGGLLEVPYELSNTEVPPDLDHALLPIAFAKPIDCHSHASYRTVVASPLTSVQDLSCRGPPFNA